MEEIFVERRLQLSDGAEVVVRFLLPVDDGTCHLCNYTIIWPDRERNFHGAGIDGVQALLHAMCNAHADLLASREGKKAVHSTGWAWIS